MAQLSREQLIEKLSALTGGEEEHYDADMLLLEYINDEEVTEFYLEIQRWYS